MSLPKTFDGHSLGDLIVDDKGISKIVRVDPDYSGYTSELIMPRAVFVEAYKKYIIEETKSIGEIRVNIPDDEKDKIIEELRKEPHPIVFEPEEDTAFWITDEYGRKICSKCQFPFAEFQSHNYCSLCGRRMIGGTD